MQPGARIDYKTLRRINPEAARRAVLEYLASCGHNIAETARVFGITRPVVYDILAKQGAGNLQDRSRAPHRQPHKSLAAVEDQVVAAKNKTRLGPKRLARYLAQYHGLQVPWATIRHILRRNRHRLTGPASARRRPSPPRPFVDWYAAKPFEVVQIDLKYIRDHKALTKQQILHLDRYAIPNYQWSALDVNSRFSPRRVAHGDKLMAYSYEKSWSNGLCFYLWAISWLRSHGVTATIVFTVDHGEEFGGKSWLKLQELRKLIGAFGCKLIQNHKGHPEENAHLERSHRTDDEKFYIPRVTTIKTEQELLQEALGYLYYYNNVREHSALDYRTPSQHLNTQLPELNDNIRYVVPILLDKVAVQLGPWGGYHLLAQHLVLVHYM